MKEKRLFSDDELLKIANEHRVHFTSTRKWNEYARKNGLPHHQTFIQRFGSWNDVKEKLGLQTNNQYRPLKYSKTELLKILSEHSKAYTSINAWNMYAKKHQLPTHGVFERQLGINQLEELTPFNSKEIDLKELILTYFPIHPPTVTEWKDLSKNISVPHYMTIIRKFGSWNLMKNQVYKK